MNLEDRIVGCVLGLALGDAFGAPYEGAPSEQGAAPAATPRTASGRASPRIDNRRHRDGAQGGAARLPVDWLDRLADRAAIEAEARALAELVSRI